MTLDDLGSRICVLGPANSGKSTLASAIGKSRGLPPIHLDQLRHISNTNCHLRPIEFIFLHDAAIKSEKLVIDGNYNRCLPQRLARATGIFVLDASTATSLIRYFRRSWFERERRGTLEGGSNRVMWEIHRHIAGVTRGNRSRYNRDFNEFEQHKL